MYILITSANAHKKSFSQGTSRMRRMPTPVFTRGERWSKYKHANNCYAYAIGDFRKSRAMKSIPGWWAGIRTNHPFTYCKGIKDLVLADGGKNIKVINPKARCQAGWHKVVLVTSPQGDFHWARLNKSVRYFIKSRDTLGGIAKFFGVSQKVIKDALRRRGLKGLVPHKVISFKAEVWSHKRGWATPPLLTGSDGKPLRGLRAHKQLNYPGMNYKNFCGAYCVKTGKMRVGPRAQGIRRMIQRRL